MSDELRAAAERALEALSNCGSEYGHRCNRCDSEIDEGGSVVAALRAALAAEQPQPVAICASEIAKIIRHARAGNQAGVESYALLLCDKLDAANPELSRYLRRVIAGDDGERVYPAAPPAPAEQPQPSAPSGWIACDERMPDAGVEVLVWLAAPAFKGSSNVAMDTWDEQHEAPVAWSSATIPVGMGWDSRTDWERITHWMPLPAAPGVAPPPSAPQAEAPSQFARGIDAAARFVEKRLADYDAEHGSTDPDTGTREYPGTGDEYACELAEIAEAIRALAPPPAAAPTDAMVEAAVAAWDAAVDAYDGEHPMGGSWTECRARAMRAAIDAALAAREGR